MKSILANSLFVGGIAALVVAAGLVYIPAGIAVAGIAAVVIGILLVRG